MARRIFSMAALIGAIFAAACTPQSPDMESREELSVGGILSLTGPAAAYGGDTDRGARLAVAELERDGFPYAIDYLVADDQTNQVEAGRVARNLIDAERVDVILGPAISPSAVRVGQLADERGIAMVGTSPTLDAVTRGDDYTRANVFRVCFNDSFQGRALASFAYNELGLRRAAVIYDNTLTYSIGLAATFSEEFERLGGEITHRENYTVTDTDYSALITKVERFRTDALFIPGWDENVGPMLNQANGRLDDFVVLGGDGWPTNRLTELANSRIPPRTYALSHFIPTDPSPTVQRFQEAYRAEYGEEPTPFAALGYDAMMIIADAARRAGSTDRMAIRNAISATDSLELVTGRFSFDEYGDPLKEGVIVSIDASGYEFVQRVTP